MKLQLVATAPFGLEAVVKREIENLGYKIHSVENGKVTFDGDERAIVVSNLWLRTADRVLVRMGEFKADKFPNLFDGTERLPWADIIPADGKVNVSGTSVKSKLSSVPACQRMVKKAIVKSLMRDHKTRELKEDGREYSVKISILKDLATLTVDTSGVGLHKRGYRVAQGEAPLKETLASALVQLSFWNPGRILLDPFCGSGTIPIEAAMILANRAPGLGRNFAAEYWNAVPEELWQEERQKAFQAIKAFDEDVPLAIHAMDIDEEMVRIGRKNAIEAGVEDLISFERGDGRKLQRIGEAGVVVTNPPYAQRIGTKDELAGIYGGMKRFFHSNPDWSLFVVTSDKGAEKKIMGRNADRKRKLYNGRTEICYYQFHGKRPGRDDIKNK